MPNSKTIASDCLAEFAGMLRARGIQFMLDGGTALGAYRDGDFCLDDHRDIDFTTLASPIQMDGIAAEASMRGFRIETYLHQTDLKTAQLSLRKNGIKVDLEWKRIHQGSAWWVVGTTYKCVPAKHYIGFNEVYSGIINGRQYPIPNYPDEYFASRYGDWRTPVHCSKYSCYLHDRSIVSGGFDEIMASDRIEYSIGIAFGAFELLHTGHINLIRNASHLCRHLIIGLSTDERIHKFKGHWPMLDWHERAKILSCVPGVSEIVAQKIKADTVNSINPDVIFVGSDWSPQTFEGNNLGALVVYLPYTPNISTSIIRHGR